MDPQQALPSLALNLASAVVASSTAPLLLLDGNLSVIKASNSFCHGFQLDPASLAGRPVGTLGSGEWGSLQLATLLRATAAGHADIDAYEMDLQRTGKPPRRLVLNAHRLDYSAVEPVFLLLSVTDVTEARIADRLRDDMVREKAMLLQELQHRVANSLQIIASVLLQSARRVQSEETRSHLHAAHQRVMSVAAVQKQLAASSVDDVALRSYLQELCASLGASMIRDHDQLSIEVTADDSIAAADVSISLGLIVTELVINALKHAFPGDRGGHINVGYHGRTALEGWTLTVRDDGAGMEHGAGAERNGLGTSIVQALARQLHADVRVTDGDPGTVISVVQTKRQEAAKMPV